MPKLIPHDEKAEHGVSRAHEQQVSQILNSLIRTMRLIDVPGNEVDTGYTPGVPTNWSPIPETVWEALDELAAAILQARNPSRMPSVRDGEDGVDGFPIPGKPGADGISIQGRPGLDGADGEDAWPIPGPKGDPAPMSSASAIMMPVDGEDGDSAFQFPPPLDGRPGLDGKPGLDGNDGEDAWATPGAKGDPGAPAPIIPGFDGDDGDDGLTIPSSPGRDGISVIGPPGRDGSDGEDTYFIPTQSSGGNATTATALQTPREINGVSFDGTANIAVPFLKNRLTNGRFVIDQRNLGVSTVSVDNAYWADRWRSLFESTLKCQSRDTTVGGGRFNGAVIFTGTTSKGGIWQVIEGIDCKDLRGKAVVLSATLSVSNTRLGDIRMGIVEFTGTEDAVSGDPISAWGSGGGGVTLATNYALLNTPANLSVTTTPTTYSVTATVGASANNLAVVIWNDDTSYTANDTLYVTDAQLVEGSIAPPYEFEPISILVAKCSRYYEKSSAIQSAPSGNGNEARVVPSNTVINGQSYGSVKFGVRKRAVPTVTGYGYGGTVTTVSNGGGTDLAANSFQAQNISDSTFSVSQATGGNVTTTFNVVLFHWTADAEL